MIIKQLYNYTRPDGGVTVTPVKPECEYKDDYLRLIADEGKNITNGVNTCMCIDIPAIELGQWADSEEVLANGDF